MLPGYVICRGSDGVVVIPVIGVVNTPVVTDRSPALVHEGVSPDDRPRGSGIEIDARERSPDPTVLDDVVDAGWATTPRRGGPLGDHAYPDLLSHSHVLERAAPSEVLDIDARRSLVDVDSIEERLGCGGPRPK